MSSFFDILKKAFPFLEKENRRALFLGLDSSGRTTALYRLKLDEVITTIPTIGFNVETIDTPNAGSWTVWDVGGCDKIRPLWRHYFQNTSAVFWFVDSTDRERAREVNHELSLMIAEKELTEAPFIIVANKQDLPNAMTPAEVAERLNVVNIFRDQPWRYSVVSASGARKEGLYEMFEEADRLVEVVAEKIASSGADSSSNNSSQAANPKEDEEAVLLKWLAANDDSDDVFLEKFTSYTLEDWTHRTHLRIAWLLLNRHGRREGMKRIFEGIKQFIAHSKRTNGKTFHETLTYFWTHMVHYAIISMKHQFGGSAASPIAQVEDDDEKAQTSSASSSSSSAPSEFIGGLDAFREFLVLNPVLSNGALYLDYYSHKLMMQTAESRSSVVLPDVKPLPSIIPVANKPSSSSSSSTSGMEEKKQQPDEDDLAAFTALVEAHKLSSWGHPVLIRLIFAFLSRVDASNSKSRSAAVDSIFTHVRTQLQGDFNFSLLYFWIQLVDHARHSLLTLPEFSILQSVAELKWSQFKSHRSLQGNVFNQLHWTEYYNEATLFSATAAAQMTLPDKKPLPSLIVKKK